MLVQYQFKDTGGSRDTPVKRHRREPGLTLIMTWTTTNRRLQNLRARALIRAMKEVSDRAHRDFHEILRNNTYMNCLQLSAYAVCM